MKSYFLLLILLSTFASQLWAQPTAVTRVNKQKTDSFQNFCDRLRIGYFGVPTTPNLDDVQRGRWKNGATSPEFGQAKKGEGQNRDTWPTNIWSQLSFNYNFGAKLNFVVNPRFMVPLASPRDMKAPEDRSFIQFQDFLVGFQGVIFSSDDKKFNLWIRPGVRLPTSHTSRNSGNGGFGRTTHELELAYNPTYDLTKNLQLGVFGQFRNWVFNDRYNYSRFRFYTAPYFAYALNETTKIQTYFEHMWENNKRWESVNGKKPVFKDVWQDLMIGVAKDITPKLNVYPFIGTFVNRPISDKSFWFGAWVSYQIK